jgi:hypothetical protein
MNARWFILLAASLLAALYARGATLEEDLKSARRIVDGRTHDLTALIRWDHTTNNRPARPLKGWVKITGQFVRENMHGWVVQGEIDGQPQPRPFIVRNPPKATLTEFNRLRAQRAALVLQRDRLADEVAALDKSATEIQEQQRQLGFAYDPLLDARFSGLPRLRTQLADLDRQVKSFDSRGFDLDAGYRLNCFALKTLLSFDGMLIYDHGTVLR